ncbi:mitotic spindle checkpoint protein BUBR1 [Mangifera indica]|uniref:mitotic spindle checkpoint protein BUBR1 n=1 Tax=Mangifera indica TaxID=29780 RepID=UPI001CF93747|nr:mitotic spindle checkpoint protein BUBR1 [Mangifera indica]
MLMFNYPYQPPTLKSLVRNGPSSNKIINFRRPRRGIAVMEDTQIQSIDPETQFLASKQETGNEWELFKENVRPLKRGRNIRLLNHSLASHNDIQLKKSLLDNRRRLIEAIDEYQGDDPLHPWIQCIKWVQEAFPAGGDSSGLVVLYEQCVRTFWHSERYKDDLRYLKVWLEYAENCVDAEVIYSFLDANDIGKTHSAYYIAYALHMESKSKMKAANDLFSLGISRNAQPTEKLKDAYKKFLVRSMRRPKAADEDLEENHLPARSFGTVLAREDNRRQTIQSTDQQRKKLKTNGSKEASFHIYKDTKVDVMSSHQPDKSKIDHCSWHTLGVKAERNKENNAVPVKWTSYKIPQRSVSRVGGATASNHIEVFIDEECAETHETHHEQGEHSKSSTLKAKQGDGQDIKRETELLRKNPLRNFPPNSLPR